MLHLGTSQGNKFELNNVVSTLVKVFLKARETKLTDTREKKKEMSERERERVREHGESSKLPSAFR